MTTQQYPFAYTNVIRVHFPILLHKRFTAQEVQCTRLSDRQDKIV